MIAIAGWMVGIAFDPKIIDRGGSTLVFYGSFSWLFWISLSIFMCSTRSRVFGE